MKDNNVIHPIGTTKSGKSIYDTDNYKYYFLFTEEDHKDASDFHFKRWGKKNDELESKYGGSYRARMKWENNRELTRLDKIWSHHSNVYWKMRNEREALEKKERRLAKSKIVLSPYEQHMKEQRAQEAKEFRQKKKNLEYHDMVLVSNLEAKLARMKWMHPQDSINFGVSVAEERRNVRARIKSIINKSVSTLKQ